jgi:hypothetical protein
MSVSSQNLIDGGDVDQASTPEECRQNGIR